MRPTMRFVPVKSTGQQDLQSLHRARDRLICQRTALINHTRGLLAEYGIVLPQGPWRFTARAPPQSPVPTCLIWRERSSASYWTNSTT